MEEFKKGGDDVEVGMVALRGEAQRQPRTILAYSRSSSIVDRLDAMAIVPVEIRAEGVSYSVVVDADEARSRFSLPRRILSFFKGPLPSKKKKKKKLLDDVWVTAHGGELHAVMGESGSGKSTLLSVLLARTYAGELEGRVTYDGDTASPRSVRPVIKSVPQEAVLRGTNTAREILRLACLLMLPQLSRNRVERHVANLLTRLHLEDCGDVVVGDAFVKGLSGGQRRRLSIALELVTIPAALALDEPTSGLDSRSSLEVVKILRGLASDNCNVMCAIHSPSAATFALFDRVTLLWAGRVAFSGLVQRLDEYLVEDCGDAPWEQGTSLAEHALDVLADSGDVLCERWSDCARESAKGSVPLYVHEKSLGNDDDDDDLDARLASGLRSFWLLFADTLRATVRNPREGRFRLKAATVVSTLTAVCFLRLRNTQRWAYSRRGLLCVECLFLFLMSASPTSVLLVLEKSWIQHGHHNAHFVRLLLCRDETRRLFVHTGVPELLPRAALFLLRLADRVRDGRRDDHVLGDRPQHHQHRPRHRRLRAARLDERRLRPPHRQLRARHPARQRHARTRSVSVLLILRFLLQARPVPHRPSPALVRQFSALRLRGPHLPRVPRRKLQHM